MPQRARSVDKRSRLDTGVAGACIACVFAMAKFLSHVVADYCFVAELHQQIRTPRNS
jgi:hypothetical protein